MKGDNCETELDRDNRHKTGLLKVAFNLFPRQSVNFMSFVG